MELSETWRRGRRARGWLSAWWAAGHMHRRGERDAQLQGDSLLGVADLEVTSTHLAHTPCGPLHKDHTLPDREPGAVIAQRSA